MPQTPLEETEKLEQLRAIENGYIIQVAETAYEALGIDTPADYEAFVERHRAESQ
jgi:3-deoxy-manno-octulosonate cytidylyltransferase (CMP-KDO synthetase)